MPNTLISPEDRRAIYTNLRQYAWCLDRADSEGVSATFTRDGIVESATQFQNPGGLQEFVRNAAKMPGFAGRQHHVQPLLIEKSDDGYLVTSYFMVITSHVGKPPFILAIGYYRDSFVLEDGNWRFKKKILTRWDAENAPLVHRSA